MRSEAELELMTMNSKVTHKTRDSELKRYQAIEEEQKKWEARESRLVNEILQLKRQLLKVKESSQVQGGVSK